MSEVWVDGVSTRKMDCLVNAMGIKGISRRSISEIAGSLDGEVDRFRNRMSDGGPHRYLWLDATMVKCRECGSLENVAVVVAVGVNDEGYREILGVEMFTSEDEASWTAFLRGLRERGLTLVKLVGLGCPSRPEESYSLRAAQCVVESLFCPIQPK